MNFKKAFVSICLFFTSILHIYSQSSSPIIGYDRVVWGATLQNVQQNYPGLRERISEKATVSVREFIQINIGGGITARVFYFFENKLYRVFVDYDDVNSDTAIAIIERIATMYGQFDDFVKSSQASSGGGSGTRYSFVRNYRNNMDITVNAVDYFNSFNIYSHSSVGVVYIDPTVQNRIDEALR